MQIVVSNISVEVIRKNIKNMHLSVLPPDGRAVSYTHLRYGRYGDV